MKLEELKEKVRDIGFPEPEVVPVIRLFLRVAMSPGMRYTSFNSMDRGLIEILVAVGMLMNVEGFIFPCEHKDN